MTGVPVEIYAYSRTGKIQAPQLLNAMDDMLEAAGKFLGRLPVDRYTFLYHFEDQSAGAWEHSVSSEYVFQESEFTDSLGRYLTDIAAHEFFHIVTPLNIHSEIIEHFNFVTPVPSQHLWLYEGTTEWAAHAMQLRAGLKRPENTSKRCCRRCRSIARRSTPRTASGSWRSLPTAIPGRNSMPTSTCAARSRRGCSTSGCSSFPAARRGCRT